MDYIVIDGVMATSRRGWVRALQGKIKTQQAVLAAMSENDVRRLQAVLALQHGSTKSRCLQLCISSTRLLLASIAPKIGQLMNRRLGIYAGWQVGSGLLLQLTVRVSPQLGQVVS